MQVKYSVFHLQALGSQYTQAARTLSYNPGHACQLVNYLAIPAQ